MYIFRFNKHIRCWSPRALSSSYIEAYKPGKSKIRKLKKVIKLSANESALGMSPRVKTINMEFPNQDPFFNINTKQDLEQAKELLKK